ncbi:MULTISPECIES: exonuclease domain-containing protein [unclassified Arthrobacter]|uniref:exonuclease domain-containing protein n=1 Tax=unclassified Arthrobacter TaxID=235627 RepID=UPI001C8431E0|nr:exonuclease domain-containing protein [Arthrobacter sp. MAHUQ-56]MBX7446004.1 DNA polymerase III subunit epsilon [Arthrobacter sp. MAHUQ-56]
MPESMFAVVDVETTGLFTAMNHRVAEIGVVRVDATGKVIDRWETLVNPGRDLGPQRIHGIRAADIIDAPTFKQVAPALLDVLEGSIMVAHNLRFDAEFLANEFSRADISLPKEFLGGLCTMRLAHDYVQGNARSLEHCCEFLSVENYNAHCAGDDALAAATLLGRYIDMDPTRPDWEYALTSARRITWPSYTSSRQTFKPALRPAGERVERHFLSRITSHMPEFTGPEEHEQYLELLSKAMLDLHLSVHETRELLKLADELGISRERCLNLHHYYLEQLIRAAWADGVVTNQERDSLYLAADLLAISREVVDQKLASPPAPCPPVASPTHSVRPGAVIVLTGAMSRERAELAGFLTEMQYTVADGVTKKTDLVVAADPDSLSGKAAKARKYGIPVVKEQYLYDVIGVPSLSL